MNPDPKVWLGEDGILRIEYPQNFHVTLEAMRWVYQEHIKITTEKRPVLVYMESVASAEYEAREFASSKEIVALTSSLAIIAKSFFTRALGDMFMKFHKPPYPTRIFNDEQKAIDWLRQTEMQTRQAHPS